LERVVCTERINSEVRAHAETSQFAAHGKAIQCNFSLSSFHQFYFFILLDKNVEPEYPERHSPCHLVFEKTGVEVIAASYKTTDQQVPCDLVLQAFCTSESTLSDLLGEDELLLSPTIKLISSTRLDGMLEVCIPHSANMVLSCQKWNVILKEFVNNKWVAMNGKEGQGIKNFISKSNHVRFETDHLSTFAIVGKYDNSSLSVLKRMKIAAFCSETKVGEDLRMRLYCFDDCEWSFEVRFLLLRFSASFHLNVCQKLRCDILSLLRNFNHRG